MRLSRIRGEFSYTRARAESGEELQMCTMKMHYGVSSELIGCGRACLGIRTDNLNSIQTWALEEARRRLEAEGILPDPDAKPKE